MTNKILLLSSLLISANVSAELYFPPINVAEFKQTIDKKFSTAGYVQSKTEYDNGYDRTVVYFKNPTTTPENDKYPVSLISYAIDEKKLPAAELKYSTAQIFINCNAKSQLIHKAIYNKDGIYQSSNIVIENNAQAHSDILDTVCKVSASKPNVVSNVNTEVKVESQQVAQPVIQSQVQADSVKPVVTTPAVNSVVSSEPKSVVNSTAVQAQSTPEANVVKTVEAAVETTNPATVIEQKIRVEPAQVKVETQPKAATEKTIESTASENLVTVIKQNTIIEPAKVNVEPQTAVETVKPVEATPVIQANPTQSNSTTENSVPAQGNTTNPVVAPQ